MSAVGDRGLRSERVLQMVTVLGNAAMDFFLPDDLAGLQIEAIDQIAVNFLGRLSVAAEVETFLDRFEFSAFLDGGGDEDFFAPDDRRLPSTPWNCRLPGDAVRRTPGIGQPEVGTYSRRRRAA